MIRKISKSRRRRIIEDIDLELVMMELFLLFLLLFVILKKNMIILAAGFVITLIFLFIFQLLLKKNLSDKFIPNFLK